MSKQHKDPIDLMPLAYVAFWIGLFGLLALMVWMNHYE